MPILYRLTFLCALLCVSSAHASWCGGTFARMFGGTKFVARQVATRPLTSAKIAVGWTGARIVKNVFAFNLHFHKETAKPLAEISLFGVRPFTGSKHEVPKRVMQSLRFLEDFTNPVLRRLFPGLLSHLSSPTDRAFRALWKDPHRATPPEVQDLLKKYGKLEEFEKSKERLAKMPLLRRVGNALGHFETWGFRLVAMLAAANAAALATDDDATPSLEKYLTDKKYEPTDEEVQLIVESVPFPHLAIRIGDMVYSYGVSHMSASTPEQYLGKKRLDQMMKDVGAIYRNKEGHDPEEIKALQAFFPEEETLAMTDERAPATDSSGKSLRMAAAVLPLKGLNRTVQVVTLKIGKVKRDELRRYFEMHKGMVYDNRTFVNDCSTMVMRPLGTLGILSPLIDPSPSTVVTTLQASRLAGDSRVGRIFQVGVDAPEKAKLHILRNAYINYMEGGLYLTALPFNLPERLNLDRKKTNDELQMWPESVKQQFAEWKVEAKRMVDEEKKLQFFVRRANELGARPETDATRRTKTLLKKLSDEYLDEELSRAKQINEDPNASLKAIFASEYRLELLGETKKDLQGKLGP